MKNHCKNNKTILLNKNPFEYFENNYQQFLFQKVMRDSKNTYVPVMGITPNAERLTPKLRIQKSHHGFIMMAL